MFSKIIVAYLFINSLTSVAIAADGSIYLGVAFRPPDHCEVKPSGAFTNCKALPRSNATMNVVVDRVTPTASVIIKKLPVTNELSLAFPCSASAPINASLIMGERTFTLQVGNLDNQVRNSVRYDSASTYSLHLMMSSFTTINATCQIIVQKNLSFIEPQLLKLLADMQISQLRTLRETLLRLDPSSELQTVISGIQEGIIVLKEQLLESEDPIARSMIEKAILRLETGRDRINLNCQGGLNLPLCTQSIADVRNSISNQVDAAESELREMSDFILVERMRLQTVAPAIAASYENISIEW